MNKKNYLSLKTFSLGLFLILTTQAINANSVFLYGEQAKHTYNTLTGPSVQQEGAAGHLYRKGTGVLCRYTDADITKNGQAVPQHDPSRYVCKIRFNHNGSAFAPGHI